MKNVRIRPKITGLMLIACFISGCGREQDVPRREEGEIRPPVTLIEKEPELDNIEEENEFPAHEQAQKSLNQFLAQYSEIAGSEYSFAIEKDFVYGKFQNGSVFSIVTENDISLDFWVKPDEEKVWKVNYYKDSGTGKVFVEINGQWLASKEIEKASELYIWQNEFLIIMLTEGNEEKINSLRQILGEPIEAEEYPF